MTSADFSQFVVTTADETVCETLRIRCALSHHPPAASNRTSGNLLGFLSFCRHTRISGSSMRFLSVRAMVCLQLPSDSASRGTPLLFRYVLPRCPGVPGTFTPSGCAHGTHTKRSGGLSPAASRSLSGPGTWERLAGTALCRRSDYSRSSGTARTRPVPRPAGIRRL